VRHYDISNRSRNSFTAISHKRLGLRSPASASSMIRLAMISLATSPVCKPKGYASHFECDAHDPLGLGVEFESVQEWGNRHDALPHRRERDRSLSHRRLAQGRCR
jgi:hypothetical protein